MDPKLSFQIADAVESEILDGSLLPGAPLQQEALAARYQVSRQPVRAALEILRERRLVTLRPDRSVAVEGLDVEAFDEVMAIRGLLESEALRQALPALTPRDLLAARQLQERLEVEDDPVALADLDGAFHAALYAPCGNRRLLPMIEALRRETRRAYRGQPPGSAQRGLWNSDHRGLLAACESSDAVAAAAQLKTHLERARERCPQDQRP